nr:MAG TPA: helix-turn-helix domain protein [Caudoviricetes sp.]
MLSNQLLVSRAVRRFMDANHITQGAIARVLGVNQGQVSARLRGATRWSLDDLDRLAAAGVPIVLASTDPEEVATNENR